MGQPHRGRSEGDGGREREQEAAARIVIRSGVCPIAGQRVYALWEGELPIVAATTFLRDRLDFNIQPTTLRTYAFALLSFFRWIATHFEDRWEFWAITVEQVRWYKRDLQRRTRLAEDHPRFLRVSTANFYLNVLERLWTYWYGPISSEPGGRRIQGHGAMRHLTRRAVALKHPAFFIPVPMKERGRKKEGLPRDVHDAVWRYLESARPKEPDFDLDELDDVPTTPQGRDRLERADFAYERRRMLYYRNKAIWGFLLASGCRLGELVRARRSDVREIEVRTLDGGTEWAWYHSITDHVEDRYLGNLKTAERRIYIGHEQRYVAHVKEWIREGLPIAKRIRQINGVEEHPMLFCNRNGGPLTKGAVYELFHVIDDAVGISDDERKLDFSPHIVRHTIATFFAIAGVPIPIIQQFLGHKWSATTDRYVGQLQPAFRVALSRWLLKLDERLLDDE